MDHIRIAALALVTMFAVSGCGGSSATKSSTQPQSSASTASTPPAQVASSTSKPSKPLTRAALIAKADLICKRVNAKRASVTISSQEEYGRFMSQLAAYEQATLVELGKLTPPAALASDWQAMMAQTRTIAENTARISADSTAKNLQAQHALILSTEEVQAKLLALAKHSGFRDCARVN